MIKIYPSSVAFKSGDLVFTQYSSGCLRSQLLRLEGLREDIDPVHADRGAMNEDVYAEEYAATSSNILREEPFKLDVPGYDAQISGRIDFIVDGIIREHKSTESSAQINSIRALETPSIGQVAQLLIYLMAKGQQYGQLIRTGYKKSRKTKVYEKVAEGVYDVRLSSNGAVTINNKPYEFTAHDLIEYIVAVAKLGAEKVVAPRPYGYDSFAGPCRYCTFQNSCRLYDEGVLTSISEFVTNAREELQRKESK